MARVLRKMRGLDRAASMASSVGISAEVRTVSCSVRLCGHGEEEDAPADHRDEGEELGQPLGGLNPSFFGATARLHYLVKHLCFPAQGVPFELLDGHGEISDRQIGHQLPVERSQGRECR